MPPKEEESDKQDQEHKESSKQGQGLDRAAIKTMLGDKTFENWIRALNKSP